MSFTPRRDEIVGLIGPNGAGKTTLLRLITKILRPDAGRIVFNGEDISGLRAWDIVERIADLPEHAPCAAPADYRERHGAAGRAARPPARRG